MPVFGMKGITDSRSRVVVKRSSGAPDNLK
jgi:hypothetical protein